MGFTLSVKNAPFPATQWGAYCNCETTLQPNSVQEQPTKPYGLLPLEERWECLDPAPGENWLDIGCFDSEDRTVKESVVFVTILDDRDYVFDFATETLTEAIPTVSLLPLAVLAGVAVLGIGAAMAFAMAKPTE